MLNILLEFESKVKSTGLQGLCNYTDEDVLLCSLSHPSQKRILFDEL